MKVYHIILFILCSVIFCQTEINAQNKSSEYYDFSKNVLLKNTKEKGIIVNDYSKILEKGQELELSEILQNYEIKTTKQIVLVTIDNITPYKDIHKFATDLGSYWGVGTKEKNNGLLIVLCKDYRSISIATGTGTEKILTDEICKSVIDNIMIPKFRNGKFYKGLKLGIEELINKWN